MTDPAAAAIRGDMPMFVGGDDAVVETVRLVIEAMVTAKLAVCKLIEDDAGIDLRVPGGLGQTVGGETRLKSLTTPKPGASRY